MSAENEKLIELIKNRPQIYNYNLREHSDRRVIEELWVDVAQEMKWEVNECKKQWGVCRNSYARCLRVVNEPITNAKKRKIWYLFDAMNFLQEFMNINKMKKSKSYRIKEQRFSGKSSKRRKHNTNDGTVLLEIKSESPNLAETVEEFLNNNLDKSENSIEKDTTSNQMLCTEATPEIVNNDHILELSLPQAMRKEIDEFEDPNMLFFKSLLPDLEKLSEQRQRLFRRNTFLCLHNLIDEEESGSQVHH